MALFLIQKVNIFFRDLERLRNLPGILGEQPAARIIKEVMEEAELFAEELEKTERRKGKSASVIPVRFFAYSEKKT